MKNHRHPEAARRFTTKHHPPGSVYVGRSHRLGGGVITDSHPRHFGNPFIEGRDGERKEVVAQFEALIRSRPELIAKVATLRGRDLCCHCKPGTLCHGDVILKYANAGWF